MSDVLVWLGLVLLVLLVIVWVVYQLTPPRATRRDFINWRLIPFIALVTAIYIFRDYLYRLFGEHDDWLSALLVLLIIGLVAELSWFVYRIRKARQSIAAK